MKIAMLGHKRIPSREGGVEVVVEELATRMVQRGNCVTCFNRKGHHVSGKEYDVTSSDVYNGVQIKDVFTIQRRGLSAMTSSFFASIHAALGKFDVVHFHAEGPAFFSFIPHFFRKKVIVTIHGLDWNRAKWGKFSSWYIKQGEKNAVKYADEIIVLSRAVKDYFKCEYGRETKFIPNGVNKPNIMKPQEIKKWGLDKDNYILFLGRIVPEKGLRYLIEAWKQINTDKKLVIAGGSSDTDEFVKELKTIDENVIFTGFVQGSILEELYSNAYVYTLPSDLEGMPLSLLEAMSYGNCCLVSDIHECASVIENMGVTFKKSNVEDLKEKLVWLLDNNDIVDKYKNKASEFICRKYDWDDVVEKTLELYKLGEKNDA